jgi:hypothetical protein
LLEAVESAKAGDAIDTAKAKTEQSMRLIEVMGAKARKWKQGEPAESRPQDAHRHLVTAGQFYRESILAADSLDPVDKQRAHRHAIVPSALYSRLDPPG